MSVGSLEFLLSVLVVSAFFHWLRPRSLRRGLLAVLNGLFLATHLSSLESAAALALFVLSGYGAALWLARRPSRLVLGTYLTLLLASFAVLRHYAFLDHLLPRGLWQHDLAVVGLSYILFRQIHFLVDTLQGQIPTPGLWTYLNYQLSLFTLLSGPIDRFQNFAAGWESVAPVHRSGAELQVAYFRILWGALQVAVIGVFLHSIYQDAVSSARASFRFASIFYGYPLYLYFNFAGYCNIVIGAGSLFGLRIPENFDKPYLARNMIDFWNRWHMTLSHWLRDYLFTPTFKAIATRYPTRALSLAPACYFLVFLVAGVWHGTTSNFVVFGLLHGAGVFLTKWWENQIIRRKKRKGLRRYLASRRITFVARVVTLHYVCATFLFFPADLPRCVEIIRSMLPAGVF